MILRIALLLVSIPLLAHGAERLYLAAGSRTQAHIACEDYAVVDLQGDGASRVFGRLVAHTGWRAYAPKRGAFVSVGDQS